MSRAAIGIALGIALLTSACRARPEASCDGAEPVTVNLESWRETMFETARAPGPGAAAELARLLDQLALAPLPGEAAMREGPAGLTGPTDFQQMPLRRGDGRPDDLLVALRFRGPGGAEHLRAQLLRPLAGSDDLYCPLADELSRDKEPFEEPCLEPHDGPARSLSVEPLLGPNRHAVVVRDAGGWCGPGTSRGDRFATAWWGVEDDRLVRYLEVVTHEAWYEAPAPPSEIRRAGISLSTGWPRVITVRATVECTPPTMPTDEDCQPAESITEYHYRDGRYVAASGGGAAATSAGEPTGETSP